MGSSHRRGWGVAVLGMAGSGLLAVVKITIGILAGSTAVVADGLESAGDVGASLVVLFGLVVASKPPDENHPYGHGRFEILTALVVGMILLGTGAAICVRSLARLNEVHAPPAFYAIWPLIASIGVKGLLSSVKFRYGRQLRSSALVADAYNDLVDIVSALAALTAVGLTLYDPSRFLPADHYGGAAVGLIVIITGVRVAQTATLQLMDTMPAPKRMEQIRQAALGVPGVLGVEKCFARKTGFQYHVDLHIEVDPELTVCVSHGIATQARIEIKEKLDWIADVLVHVEPRPLLATPDPGQGVRARPRA